MIPNSQQRRRSTFETNILKFFFSKGHLLLIFVVLQIKIIHLYLSMSRMIDRVFYNPVENYSRGHPLYPSENSTLQPPHSLGISMNHPWGGYGYFLEPHNLFNKLLATRLHERWKLVVSMVDVLLQVVSIQTLAAKLHKSRRKLASFLSYSTHLYIPRHHFIQSPMHLSSTIPLRDAGQIQLCMGTYRGI